MLKILFSNIIIILSLNLKGFSQIVDLTPIVMNQKSVDSLIERYEYFKNWSPKYFTGPKPKGNWKVFNINHLEIEDLEKFDLNKNSFLKNLKKDFDYPSIMYMFIDTTIAKRDDIFYLPNPVDSNPFAPGFGFFIPYNIIENIKFLDNKIDIKKASLFVLSIWTELYLYYNEELYIVEDNNLLPAIPYLKKKYKNKEGFLYKYNHFFCE
ncbi:MAG TPA: hypothetical protein VLZ83_13035 [Edaphocola sp.]|nr:hypothetical protein [Edaphocola sp.]